MTPHTLHVRLATTADEPALVTLARQTAMGGRVRLIRPAVVRPWKDTVVAERDGEIVACGQRVRRHRYINGRLVPTAYLTALRVDPFLPPHDRGRAITLGYRLLGELHEADPRPTFTSVMNDNAPALRLIEKHMKPPRPWLTPLDLPQPSTSGVGAGRSLGPPAALSRGSGLPRYERIGNYLTVVCRGSQLKRVRPAEPWATPPQFAPPIGPCHNTPEPPWEVELNLAGRTWRRRADLTCVWKHAGAVTWPTRPFDRYLVGGHADDTFVNALASRRGVCVLRSTLFAVRWPGDTWQLDGRPVSPEVADL